MQKVKKTIILLLIVVSIITIGFHTMQHPVRPKPIAPAVMHTPW